MSIVLQGSTSGSITLQEPAVAGSNTINLPAATGTAVLTGVSGNVDINAAGSNNVTLSTNSTERVRVDSSGNVGIGTSSPASKLDISTGSSTGTTDMITLSGLDNGSAKQTYGVIQMGIENNTASSEQGNILLQTVESGTVRTRININGSGYMAFSNGGTERMRITSGGGLLVGKTTAGSANAGMEYESAGGALVITRASDVPFIVNRITNDGTLIRFLQDTVEEGSISVSGNTVSYNGGHLSRWSQLPSNQKDDSILKGTVMSNLDDMCVWTKDGEVLPNEQLNKMKVSDVEGDTNVAGVFVNWTRDEDCNSDDMNVAMTGDMIIRIADGVVVQKGDLLMSAGDGTAKPQGDDIVRSKTIAKVTSNHVTCTYEDGSYCVPCVLMAC